MKSLKQRCPVFQWSPKGPHESINSTPKKFMNKLVRKVKRRKNRNTWKVDNITVSEGGYTVTLLIFLNHKEA